MTSKQMSGNTINLLMRPSQRREGGGGYVRPLSEFYVQTFHILNRRSCCCHYLTIVLILGFSLMLSQSTHLHVVCRHSICLMLLFQGHVACQNLTLKGPYQKKVKNSFPKNCWPAVCQLSFTVLCEIFLPVLVILDQEGVFDKTSQSPKFPDWNKALAKRWVVVGDGVLERGGGRRQVR